MTQFTVNMNGKTITVEAGDPMEAHAKASAVANAPLPAAPSAEQQRADRLRKIALASMKTGSGEPGASDRFSDAFTLGLMKPAGGVVRVLDKPLGSWSREGLARSIAYLPQAAEIDRSFPINVYDMVAMGLWRRWKRSMPRRNI